MSIAVSTANTYIGLTICGANRLHGGFLSQEKLRLQQEAKAKKEAAKMKSEGKAVLNAMNVPFAKFEVEVTVTEANDPECPLLEHATELVREGQRIKAAAGKCLAGGGACEVKMPEVSVWLRDMQASAKALQALHKRS